MAGKNYHAESVLKKVSEKDLLDLKTVHVYQFIEAIKVFMLKSLTMKLVKL